MLGSRAKLGLALAFVFSTLGVLPVRADLVFLYNVEEEILHADLAVQATLVEGNTVEVNEVFMGPASVGQKLQVERFQGLSRKLYRSVGAAMAVMFPRPNGQPSETPLDVTGRLVLFLSKNDRQQWETEGEVSGVKWLVDGKVYGYQQVLTTESPCSLVPDREARTEPDLRRMIQAAIAKKDKFTAARSIADPARRVEALAPYIQPEEKNGWYFAAAVEALGKAGPVAGPLLRRESQRPNEFYSRREILRALGTSGDPEAAPFLLAIAEPSAPFMKAIEPYREKTLTEMQRAVLNDWNFAIYVLSEMADQRTLPALREAMLWSVNRHGEMFESASRGLGKLPTRENLPFFAQALASAGKNEWAVYYCILALKEHRYPETVPILANQLKFPARPASGHDQREYNARVAHAALEDIVGKDLGTDKKAWIKWFEEQKE